MANKNNPIVNRPTRAENGKPKNHQRMARARSNNPNAVNDWSTSPMAIRQANQEMIYKYLSTVELVAQLDVWQENQKIRMARYERAKVVVEDALLEYIIALCECEFLEKRIKDRKAKIED